MENKEQGSRPYKTIGILAGIFFAVALLPVGAYFIYENKYNGKIYPGTRIGAYDFGGFTKKEARDKLDRSIEKINREGIIFHYHNQNSSLYPVIGSLEGDIAIEVIAFDPETTVNRLYGHGRSEPFMGQLAIKLRSLFTPSYYNFLFAINQNELEKFFSQNFGRFAAPAQNARLSYTRKDPRSSIEFYIEEEKYGQILDINKAAAELRRKLGNLDASVITLSAGIDYPAICKKDLLNIESEAAELAALAPLVLEYSWKKWEIDQETLAGWLAVKESFSTSTKNAYQVGMDHQLVADHLAKNIAAEIDIKPVEAKFEIDNGKVVEFQASKDGQELALDESARLMEKELAVNKRSHIGLIVKEKKSEVSTDNINDLGIKELLGTGHSNFAGSPQNRRHNIAIGAAAVNGTLVRPEEEFSLIKVLGEINAETGYLPELVIKDNRTIPEYGGGLCQIGTTAFRGTLSAGLPVTMRRNHSYRVSYYEPAGTDATIYNPWPDYRFMNDYRHYILITARIEGDDLYFDFWGTNDGREATSTYPVIHNITRPAPTLIIETPDLLPGQKRCTEHAHNGADAYFDYTVKYSKDNLPKNLQNDEDFIANDYVDTTRFKSHYVPWREVCLVGIDPNKAASSTTSQL